MEGPYIQELNEKSSGLTFKNRRLEAEYQNYAALLNNGALRLQLLLGAVFICLMMLLDSIFLPWEFTRTALMLRLGVMLPPILLMITLTYSKSGGRYLQLAGIVVGLSIGLTSLFIGVLAARYEVPRVFAGYQIIIVFVYFFLGLRVQAAVGTGLALCAAFVIAAVMNNADPIPVTYNALYLLFLNVIGALGCYQLSKARRTVFLEERILSYRANHDALTQLPNRRAFDEFLIATWDNAKAMRKPISILMMDIDHFKSYNDLYGHQAGDHAISEVAKILEKNLQRPQDFAGRYGGEEFVVLLFDATREYALELAERIREQVLAKNIEHRGSGTGKCVSISIGLSHIDPSVSTRSMKGFVQMADEALYAAKEEGRNCVVDADLSVRSTTTGVFKVAEIVKRDGSTTNDLASPEPLRR
jgi:diguanylate cyclase (GGDEF)-like protein